MQGPGGRRILDRAAEKQAPPDAGCPEVGTPEWLEQFSRELAKQESAKVYSIQHWREDQRALPTDFIACALFSAVQAKDAPYLRGEQLACINGYTVTFTGRRLTQVHADVLMGVAHLSQGQSQGHVVHFRARAFLKLIGRHAGNSQRKSLQQLLDDVISTTVRVTDPGGKSSFAGSLLTRSGDVQDGDDAVFAVEISRELCKAFTNDLAKVNFEQRKALMKQPLALWLQLYVTKFHKPVPVSELKRISGSTTRRLTDFRKQLRLALDVLCANKVIEAWHIDKAPDVLFFAPRGKQLPGGRLSQAQLCAGQRADLAAPQAQLFLPMELSVSQRTLQIVAQRQPTLDLVKCYADWRKWVSEKGIALKKPDAHFLDFAAKWGK